MSQVRELPLQCRQAAFQPATINDAERTVEMVWTTGAAVRRTDFWTGQRYDEVLQVDSESVDLSRLNSGAPLLNSHGAHDLSQIIGVVERAWLVDGEGRALVRFSERADVAPILADVKAGIIRNVSVGYNVRKYLVEEGDVPVYRAVDWQPAEISLVPIPADAGAGVRSALPAAHCEFIHRAAAQPSQEQSMSQSNGAAPHAELDRVRAEAIVAERSRVSEINTLCERHAIDTATRNKLIDENATVDHARSVVLETLAVRDAAKPTNNVRVETLVDETETRRAAVENALMHRANPARVKLEDHGRQYRGLTLLEMGRSMVEASGVSTKGMSKMDLAQRALATSDFPIILANVANKTLRAGYEAAPQTFKPWTRQTTAPDFKAMQRSQIGDAPQLKQVNEHGEFTYGTIGEGKESYQLATYGRIIALTRQTIINDDLGAFADLPAKFGRAAADLESDIVWGIVTANAAMADAIALFHASHGNLAGAGAAISVSTLGAARAAMRIQKSLDSRPINLMPRYLLVPAAQETLAQQFVANTNIVYTKGSDYNPFAGALQVLAEPRLDANSTTAWYMACDPMTIDTIEYCYLEGNEGVYIETRNGFEVDGMEIKARLDFAAKAIDFRGLYKNPGA